MNDEFVAKPNKLDLSNERDSEGLGLEEIIITNATEEISELHSIKILDGVSGVILDAVQKINSLKEIITSQGGNHPISEEVSKIEKLLDDSGSSGFGADKPDDWNVEGLTGYSLKFNVLESEIQNLNSEKSSKLTIETYIRNRILYIDVNNSLDPITEGKVTGYDVEMANGKPLPSWIRIARDGFIIVERQANVGDLELKISAMLESGEVIVRGVSIDAETGEILPLDIAKSHDSASVFSDQLKSIIRDETDRSDKLQRALQHKIK